MLISCAKKTYIKEVVENKKVYITYREIFNDKFYNLNIPIQFNLNLNSSKILRIMPYYETNGHQMTIVEDYIIINGENNKEIYGFDTFQPYHYPKTIYVVERKRKVSQNEVLDLIKKYNPSASIANLETKNDTIFLTSYSKYRKDNPKFLEDMRKQPDSLILSMWFGGEDKRLEKVKINW